MNLTPKQQAVFDWVMKGLSNKHIAQRLNIAESTVKLHVTSILQKYAVQNRLQLIAYAKQGVSNTIVPVDIEEQPFGWVRGTGDTVKGFVCGATSLGDGWHPVYLRKTKE
jgi:DNA-binding CsgD family transcriptional regulator